MNGNFAIGWRQVAACFVLLGCIAMIASSYSVLAVPLGVEFATNRMTLALAMTVVAAISALLAPLLGNIMDKASLRLMMLAGALLLSGGFLALSYVTSFTMVLIVFGLFMAPANVLMGPMAATVLLSRWFVKRRGRAIGIAIAGISLGGAAFPPLIQWLLDTYAWREAYRWLALVLLLCTLPAAALVVNSPAERGINPDGAAENPLPQTTRGGEASRISVWAVLSDPAFWLACAVVALVTSGMKGVVTNLAPLAHDVGIRPGAAALLISILAGGGLVSKLLFAAVADTLGPRRLLFFSIGGFAAGMACLTLAEGGYWVIAAGVGLIGLCGGMMVPIKSLIIPLIFGERAVGRAMGLAATVALVAGLAMPPLFGLISDVTGSYNGILYAFAALGALFLLVVPLIRLHPRGEGAGDRIAVPAE